MKNPTVYLDPETEVHRAVIELQQLACLYREHILRLDQALGQLKKDHVDAGGRLDVRLSRVRKELDQIKGVYGA